MARGSDLACTRIRPAAVNSSPWWSHCSQVTRRHSHTRHDISGAEFASRLHYDAVSRVSKFHGLMFDGPLNRCRVCRDILHASRAVYDSESSGEWRLVRMVR